MIDNFLGIDTDVGGGGEGGRGGGGGGGDDSFSFF